MRPVLLPAVDPGRHTRANGAAHRLLALRPWRRIAAALVVNAALWITAYSDGMAQGLTRPGVGAGGMLEFFTFGDAARIGIDRISLLTLPFAARADITPRVALQLSGAFARGSLTRAGGGDISISGLTDTEVRATVGLGTDAVTLSAVALLPTGKTTLTADEAEVAGVIAADVLPFRISNWGTGGGFGASIAAAAPLGGASAGVSVGYVVAREFEPLEGQQSFTYRPGNQLHVTAALDATLGATGKGSLRVSFQRFDTDQSDGANLYQSGNRIQATASYAFAAGARASGIVYAGLQHRAEGEFQVSTALTPAQNLFLAGAGLRTPLGSGVLQPSVDLRLLSGTEDAPEGYTAGIGVTVDWPVGRAVLAPTVRGRLGNAQQNGQNLSSYTGAELGLTIRFGPR